MDADIFVLEEICDCDTLEKVRQLLKKKDKYRAYSAKNPNLSDLQLGIITKIDPISTKINDRKAKFSLIPDNKIRGFVTEFNIGAQSLILYAVHLTAKLHISHRRDQAAEKIKILIEKDVKKGKK